MRQLARPPREIRRTADIKIDGSSTVFVLSEAVAEEFPKAGHGARVTVGQSGTGGGFQKFCRGETDIQRRLTADQDGRDRPHARQTASNSSSFLSPMTASPSSSTRGDVDRRDHGRRSSRRSGRRRRRARSCAGARCARAGPTARFTCLARASTPARYDYFTEADHRQARASRGDFTSSEDDNVLVQGVAGDELALGFLPFAYYRREQHRLKLVPSTTGRPTTGRRPLRRASRRFAPAATNRSHVHCSSTSTSRRRGAPGGPAVPRLLHRQRRPLWPTKSATCSSATRGIGSSPSTSQAPARDAVRRGQRPGRPHHRAAACKRAPVAAEVEWLIERLLFVCAALSVLTTAGIVARARD